MGFPFFAPAYIPGNRIRIYGCHQVLEEALDTQHSAPWFPVDFHSLAATIEFVVLEPGRVCEVAGLSVTAMEQFHSGDSYAYRFSKGAKSVVYSTDCEHKYDCLDESYPFVEFYRNADLLIFDAMYSLGDTVSVKEHWGHSNNVMAVELAQAITPRCAAPSRSPMWRRASRRALRCGQPACRQRRIDHQRPQGLPRRLRSELAEVARQI
jgi:phosphoribosyl 1,2-cyclic phosphodiesterase